MLNGNERYTATLESSQVKGPNLKFSAFVLNSDCSII